MGLKEALYLVAICSIINPGTVSSASQDPYVCHGDVCNRDKNDQFCSDTFNMCRDCQEIRDECGTVRQPLTCTLYCKEVVGEQKEMELRGIPCPVLSDVINGQHNGSLVNSHNQGDVVITECSLGYHAVGPIRTVCLDFGYWEQRLPSCQANVCPIPPTTAHVRIDGPANITEYQSGMPITITCEDGYMLQGPQIATCQLDGSWDHTHEQTVCIQTNTYVNIIWKIIAIVFITFGGISVLTLISILRFKKCGRNYDGNKEHNFKANESLEGVTVDSVTSKIDNTIVKKCIDEDGCLNTSKTSISHLPGDQINNTNTKPNDTNTRCTENTSQTDDIGDSDYGNGVMETGESAYSSQPDDKCGKQETKIQ